MVDRVLNLYQRIVLARPVLTLAVTALVVALFALQIPDLRMEASADTLVLEGDKALEFHREIAKRFGSQDFLIVTYRPRDVDLMSDVALGRLAALRDELGRLPEIESITSILDVPLLYSPRISFTDIGDPIHTLSDPKVDRELAREEFLSSPIYKDLILSPDGQETAMQLTLRRDLKWEELLERREILRARRASGYMNDEEGRALRKVEAEFRDYSTRVQEQQDRFVEEVRGTLDRYRDNADIFLGGVPMIAVDMISFARNDLLRFGGGMLLVMMAVLAIIFRRLQWVIIPLVTCGAAIVLMLGIIAWSDWPLTVVSSNFVPLLMILSLAIVIHLINYYREQWEERPDADHRQLVVETARFMFVPIAYTAATTGVAFASFVASGIKPVIDFGWMMTIGVGMAMVLAFLIVPAMLLLAGKPRRPPPARRHDPFSVHMARVVDHHGTGVLVVSAVLLVLSVVGLRKLEVENRFIDYFDESTEIFRGMENIDNQLGGTIPLSVVLDFEEPGAGVAPPAAPAGDDEFGADFDEAPADDFASEFDDDFGDAEEAAPVNPWFTTYGLQRIEEVHRYLDSLPETGKVLSLATIYEIVGDLLGGGVDDIQLAIAYRSLPEEMRDIILRPYLSEQTNQALVSVRVKETSEGLRRDELLHRIQDHLVNDLGFDPEKVHMTNMLVLYNNVLQSLFRSQILTLGVTFLAILMMFIVLFRSLYLSLLAIAPNLLAAGVVLGTMGLTGVPLDIMTITVAAIVVGIGVDDCIHYVFRFKHEFGKDRDYLAAAYRSHGSIGRAMYYTSVTIVSGFSILVLSNFTPSIYFGLLTALAMVVAMTGGLLLLPRLIILFKPLGPGGAMQTASAERV